MPRKRKEHPDGYDKAFPVIMRKLMERDNTTQQELADYLGKSRQAVAYYCDGSSSPDWETLSAISAFFHVSSDYLLGRTEIESPSAELQAICAYTGLSERAIQNLHHESKDKETISALGDMLGNDYESLHRLNRLIYKALLYYRSYSFGSSLIKPLVDYVPDSIKQEFFDCLDKWGGETLSRNAAADYYSSQAAHVFQTMIENAARGVCWIDFEDPRLAVATPQEASAPTPTGKHSPAAAKPSEAAGGDDNG